MIRKLLIALLALSTLLLSFSMQTNADQAISRAEYKNLNEETLHITNETEYAEFVKRREGAGHASSVKSTRSLNSTRLVKSSSASSASLNPSKVPVK
jgi:hypothetical protein